MAPSDTAVPTFRPSVKDCEGSWEAYISRIEPRFKKVGICKIILPKGWQPCKSAHPELREFTLKRPIEQTLTGKQGFYQALQLVRKSMSLQDEYAPLATDPANQPKDSEPDDVEREFWRSTNRHPPIYGADCEATLCDGGSNMWNISKLDSLLSRVLKDKIPGVNTSYLYFGMWRTFFGWHSEDMDLHSVNYLHYGAPKYWYCIPPEHRERFERWVKDQVPDCFRGCSEFIRHKELLISPNKLRGANIPFTRMVQHAGEMVINFPGAYHSGFNSGFNCAESTNFATKAWIPYGADTDSCTCRKDTVKIDMRHFLAYTDKETQEIIEERFFSDSNDSGSESGGEASPSGSEPESGAESEVESESEPSSWVADSDPGHQGCRSKRPRGGSSKKRTVERDPGKDGSKAKKRKENCSPKAQPKQEPAPAPAPIQQEDTIEAEECQPQPSGRRELGSRKRIKTFKARGAESRALQRRANQSREEDDNSDKEEPSGKRGSKSPPKRSDKAPKSSVQSITRALVKAKGESSKISCASQAAQTAVQA